jgi:hypothetical protein
MRAVAGTLTLDSEPRASWREIVDKLWSSAPFLWGVVFIVYAVALGNSIARLILPQATLGDFYTFRDASIALSHGRDIYASGTGEYVYPPLIAFLFQPTMWVSLHAAALIYMILAAVLSISTLYLSGAEFSRRFLDQTDHLTIARIAVVAALLTSDKIRTEFNMWETNVLVLFMFALALAWADRRPSLAGAALGFAFNIKYMPITLLPLLILRRRWRMSGGFALSAVGFALLPALSMGWKGNLSALAAAYGGLARLFKIPVQHAAHIFPMTDSRTFSATSGIARMTGLPDKYALAISASLGILFLGLTALNYRKNRLPLLQWAAASKQTSQPFLALFGLEWVLVILLTLIFSPFTNSAHLYILMLACAAGAALLLTAHRPQILWPLLIGMLVMYLGITFPPGGYTFRVAERFCKWIGLPAWCMLVNCIALMWVGSRTIGTNFKSISFPSALVPMARKEKRGHH